MSTQLKPPSYDSQVQALEGWEEGCEGFRFQGLLKHRSGASIKNGNWGKPRAL
jgi:hypothetical protein